MRDDLPCIDCLKFAMCRAYILSIKNSPELKPVVYSNAIRMATKVLTVECVDLYEFIYNHTVHRINRDTGQIEPHPAINLCRLDVVKTYHLNY